LHASGALGLVARSGPSPGRSGDLRRHGVSGVAVFDYDNDSRENLFVAARPGGTVPQHLAGQESLVGPAAEGP